jgi:YbbR domain-containing protein
MWRILFQNLWFKLVAIIMALFLWFHVATDKVYEHTDTFPLEIFNIPERLILAEKLPEQVSVTIRGKGKELLKLLLTEKKSLRIDAQEFERGETKYLIKPEEIPLPGELELRVTEILSPEDLKIKLDYPMEKKMKIQPNIKILPAEGFQQVGELHYNPKEVVISGPRMWVRGLKVIHTQEKVIEGAEVSISDQVDLVLPEGYNLSLSPQTINFSQNIEKTVERRISNLPVKLVNIPKRGEIILEPDSVSVIISGAESVINQILPDNIKVTVNCGKATRQDTVKLPVGVKLSAKVELQKVEPDSVEVLIK